MHVASAHEFIHHFIGHYVAAEGKLWATGKLASPLTVFAGALFEFPELSINLPGAT